MGGLNTHSARVQHSPEGRPPSPLPWVPHPAHNQGMHHFQTSPAGDLPQAPLVGHADFWKHLGRAPMPQSPMCSPSRPLQLWESARKGYDVGISCTLPLQARPALGNTQEGLQCHNLLHAPLIGQAGFGKQTGRALMPQSPTCSPCRSVWLRETPEKDSDAMVSQIPSSLSMHISPPAGPCPSTLSLQAAISRSMPKCS